jgi:hypothetical protein
MTPPRDERPQLDGAEEQFVRFLASRYAPPPLTPAGRVAWDEALWARLRKQPRRTRLVPALAMAAMALLLTYVSWSGLFTPLSHNGGAEVNVPTMSSADRWDYELFDARALTSTIEGEDGAILPDDYLVIARVFLAQ